MTPAPSDERLRELLPCPFCGGEAIERLAERGGLMADEACAVLEDRPTVLMPRAEANARLVELAFSGVSPYEA
jgi:hypothetical protein